MFFTERLSPFLKLIDYWSFLDQPAIIVRYYNNKVNLRRTIWCLEIHLVFGVLAGNSPIPINTPDIDMLGPPTSWLPRSFQAQFPCSQEKLIKLRVRSRIGG